MVPLPLILFIPVKEIFCIQKTVIFKCLLRIFCSFFIVKASPGIAGADDFGFSVPIEGAGSFFLSAKRWVKNGALFLRYPALSEESFMQILHLTFGTPQIFWLAAEVWKHMRLNVSHTLWDLCIK